MQQKAVIVGSGMVGALLSVILARKGYAVDVYERRPDFRKEGYQGGRSINLALSERGWKAVETAGIRDAVERVAIPMPGRMIHHADGELSFQRYGSEGQAIYSVSRAGLNTALVDIAESHDSVRIHFNQRCHGADAAEGLVHFEDAETNQRYSIETPLLFATDGAFSAVRSSLQRTPGFNYAQSYIDYGYKELHLPPDPAGRHQLDPNALHIWPRGNFMLIALPNTDGSFTCTLFLPFEGDDSFASLPDEAAVRAFLASRFPDLTPFLPDLVRDFRRNPTASLVTIRCNPWHFNGKVLLLGDASHAIVPFFGQGMNAGFEDCTILTELMETYAEDWPAILEHFNRQRLPDANAIADLALENFIEMRDKVADPQFLLWKKIEKFLQDRYPDRYRSVYSLVSFSHVPYRQALREVDAQDALRRRILALPDIAERWDSPQVEAVFEDWYRTRSH